jgi:ABC-type transport system involved in cytochrome bd biosynthesis fused ATPase/permease subunit
VATQAPAIDFFFLDLNQFTANSIVLIVILVILTRSTLALLLKYASNKILANRETDILVSLLQKSIFEKTDSFKANNSSEFLQIYVSTLPSLFVQFLIPLLTIIPDIFSLFFIFYATSQLITINILWIILYFLIFAIIIAIPIGKLTKSKNGHLINLSRASLKTFLELTKMRDELRLSHSEDSYILELQTQKKEMVKLLRLLILVCLP